MATVRENHDKWSSYDWSAGGDEWSAPWGGVDLQWWGCIWPRIQAFLPADTIVEIAPGFGRWTQFLKDQCRRLVLVDISERCIEACKRRFAAERHLSFFVNDGMSLPMVPEKSADFIFSFDSLVHAEADVLRAYLRESARVLKTGGAGFIHHSNLGRYSALLAVSSRIPARVRIPLENRGLLVSNEHWRATSMDARRFARYCREAGLQCVHQETVNWVRTGPYLIDCLSVFRRDSATSLVKRPRANRRFMRQASDLSRTVGVGACDAQQQGSSEDARAGQQLRGCDLT